MGHSHMTPVERPTRVSVRCTLPAPSASDTLVLGLIAYIAILAKFIIG